MGYSLLYLMHIDWNWIKQRPQYIEEALEKDFDVFIICPRNYRLRDYDDKPNMKVFYSIPFLRRFPHICNINSWIESALIKNRIKRLKPDVIYMTSPQFAIYIPESYKGKVVYDCMDDMLAFGNDKYFRERTRKRELAAANKADIIFASSERLKELLSDRYKTAAARIVVVRNGYGGEIAEHTSKSKNRIYTLCYFGTISHWFDFDFIQKSLDDFSDIQYRLIGPVESGISIPKNDRIIYIPPVKHNELWEATKDVDAFVMPFKLNELIRSVDPVKLYEYINFGKEIITIRYPEIERFDPFVHFYTDYQSFKNAIYNAKKADERKYSEQMRVSFLQGNSWEERGHKIALSIIELMSKSNQQV